MAALLLGLILSSVVWSARGIHIPFTRRDVPHSTSVNVTALAQGSSDPFNFVNKLNLYAATIYVQGQPFVVQLDTGSSDLWINAALPNWNTTNFNTTIGYGDGDVAAGPIVFANVTFGDFTVESQALTSAPGSNATANGEINGILGVGGHSASQIWSALENTTYDGSTVLDHVFSLYPEEPNYITFLLTRDDAGTIDGGVFTIGETVSNLSNVLSTPKLPVVKPQIGAWLTLMDGVEVNGVKYVGHSADGASLSQTNQTLVLLDTGTTAGVAPPYYVDAMYKDLPGAVFDGAGSYLLPCDTKVNISMIFGNSSYPIHPIDSVMVSGLNDTTGTLICSGVFSYSTFGGIDFILGDAFLKNVYSVYDFGNWTEVGTGEPYMQILSITDADAAWIEFDYLYTARFEALFNTLFNTLFGPSGNTTTVTSTVTVTETSAPSSGSLAAISTAFVTITETSTLSPTAVSTAFVTVTPSLAWGVIPASAVVATSSIASVSPHALNAEGALSDSSDPDSDSQSTDLHTLIRNSYIIIGLISGAMLLLLGLYSGTFASNRRNREYAPVREVYSVPPASDKPYSAEASYSDHYPNPYSEHGHQ